ncbi:MAG: hypothetical protein WCL50_07770 [Spirochaetota bacterium]
MRLRSAAILALLALSASTLLAEEPVQTARPPEFSFGLKDIKVDWFGLVPTGPVVKFAYGSLGLVPGLRSDFEGKLGFGYESIMNPRNDANGDPILWADRHGVEMPDAQIELGFRQGILPLEEKRDELSAYASLHGRVAHNFGASWASTLGDRNDELMGSLVGGLKFSNFTKNAHGQFDGHVAYLEGELGPSFLSVQGTDFWRAKAEWVEYVPLFDLEGERNLLSSYLVFRANAKYIAGSKVPLFMLEESDVRGYPYALDTKLRASGTVEARFDLPSLLGASDIFPIAFAFVDGGWYSGYNNLPAGSAYANSSGPLASVGAGMAVDVFGFARPVFSVGMPLLDQDSQGIKIIGGRNFWMDFGFDLQI